MHNSTCRERNTFSYSLRFIGLSAVFIGPTSSPCVLEIWHSKRAWSDTKAARGTGRPNDQFLAFHDEKENQTSQEKPRPHPERDRFGLEQKLERRRVREQKLQ